MKQFIVIICLGVALAACNNADKDNKDSGLTKVEGVPIAEVKMPFPMDSAYRNWQMNSSDNAVIAMNALKAFVDKDYTALAALTGDSLELYFDYLHETLSRDSAIKMFTAMRAQYNDLTIKMYDYESVISADKNYEWVTMWYKESWKNDKGIADSLSITNDIRMKNGKMVELDEKSNHFPKK
jgi:hypothetical protein